MPDAGEIKAQVTISYDGSGVDKAKEDLASLAEMGGTIGESAGQASEGLAGLDEQMVKNASSAKSFNSAISELPKILEEGTSPIAEMTDALSEHQQAVEDTGSAYEALQEPLISTVSLMQDAAHPMRALTENISATSDAWGQAGLNMQVFQEALANPDSFQTIYDHLDKTGQSIEEFSSSIGESNAQLFHEMSTDWAQTSAWVDTAGSSFESVGKKGSEGFGAVAASAADADQAVSGFLGNASKSAKMLEPIGIGEAFSGAGEGIMGALSDIAMPLMAVQMIAMAVGQVGQGIYNMAAIAEGPAAHSVGTFTGTVDALGQSAQNAGAQFSEGFGQGVLPTLNALNSQAASGNDIWGQLGGTVGAFASTIANIWQIGTGFNVVGGVEGLANQAASSLGLSQPFQGPGPSQAQTYYDVVSVVHQQTIQTQQQVSTLLEDASNPAFLGQQDQLSAAQQVYQRAQQSYDIRHPINQTQMLQQFQEQQYDQQQAQNYQYQMQNPTYGPITPGTITGYWTPEHLMDWLIGPKVGDGGLGKSLSDWWSNLFGGGGATSPDATTSMGCFVAGTRVRMVNGSEKPIETLQIGELVLAHDGMDEVTTTILALIKPPPKRVYKLTFENGTTLTTTDSHPIATPLQGWKALSVEHAKQENPGLPISPLRVGDSVCMFYGICVLTSILPLQGTRQIFNITVDNPHTFYANNVLVHNKVGGASVGQQVADQIGGITLPHIDLSGMAAGLASSFSGIELPHIDLSGLTAGLGSVFSGISLPPIPDIGSQISGELGSMFSGISLPAIPDLGGEISGALSGMLGGISLPAIPDIGGMLSGALSGAIGAISMPPIPDIGGMLSGALSGAFGGISLPSVPDIGGMINGAMSGMFGGISLPSVPDIGGMINGAMSGMFGGITIPSVPNLGAQISSAMSGMFSGISMPSIPFFAQGVQNYTGLGIVGEAGPELVSLNGGSVFPLSAGPGVGGGMTPLSLGGGGDSMPDFTLHIQMMMPDGRMMAEQTIPYMATIIRQQFGLRR